MKNKMAKLTNTQPSGKFAREMEKRMAVSDAEIARKATFKKTEKLKELRLAKEAEDRAAGTGKSKKQTKAAKEKKSPAIE